MTLTGAAFVLVFAIGCVLAFVRHPIFGTLTYVATLFLNPQMRWWGQGPLVDVRWALVSALVTAAALIIRRRRLAPGAPVMSQGAMILMLGMTLWMAVQSAWAIDSTEHQGLLWYYVKFVVAMVLIDKSVDTERHVKYFLWAYVLGCFYFGWIAFTSYEGGRFEGFGGAGLDEANVGALTIVGGIFAASSLFLAGKWRERAALFLIIPFLMNGLVTTVSRSGFLAIAAGGLIFNHFTPGKSRKQVRVLSMLAIVLFLIVAGPFYWQRIHSLEYAGEQVEGIDTGSARLEIIAAQWRMFKDHPFGCGAMCTAILSPNYMSEHLLASYGQSRVRSSHNTFMSFLVEQGLPGALIYLAMLWWIGKRLLALGRAYRSADGFLPTAVPAVAAILGAITIADLFVSYTKFEPRIWFIAVLMALTREPRPEGEAVPLVTRSSEPARRGAKL